MKISEPAARPGAGKKGVGKNGHGLPVALAAPGRTLGKSCKPLTWLADACRNGRPIEARLSYFRLTPRRRPDVRSRRSSPGPPPGPVLWGSLPASVTTARVQRRAEPVSQGLGRCRTGAFCGRRSRKREGVGGRKIEGRRERERERRSEREREGERRS